MGDCTVRGSGEGSIAVNLRGSYKRLRDNAVAALVAAVEVYNKPRMTYRDEVVVVLVVNAWELLLKAIISKAGLRIYYPKKRNEPYRTFSLDDSLNKAIASRLWPQAVSGQAVRQNVAILSTYRDNAIHFYNEPDFAVVTYSLIQTSIINFRDVLSEVFRDDLGDEISWRLLPLGVSPPVDPLTFLRGKNTPKTSRSRPVEEFLAELGSSAKDLESAGVDTGRLMTIYDTALQASSKVSSSDIVVGVSGSGDAEAFLVNRHVDPNKSHPLREKEVLARLVDRPELNQYGWRAVVWKYDLRTKPNLCWCDETTGLTKWSFAALTFAKSLSPEDVQQVRAAFAARRK